MPENRRIKIIVNMPVPEAIGYDGKTGSLIRLAEILKHLKRLDDKSEIVFNATESIARYFRGCGVEARYNILKTKLKFSSLFGLCIKAFYLVWKSFFVLGVPKSKVGEKLVVYASSDLFWEVIPACIFKMRNKEIEWAQAVMHLYPDWKKRPGNKAVGFLGYHFQKFSLFLIRKKADKIILINTLARDELLKRGFDAKKMHVSSVGIDWSYFQKPERAEVSYDGVFLGRMNASKGVADLIPIWKKVCEKMPKARLAVIGGSEKYAKIELIRKIKENGLEKNIEVLGFLEDCEAFKILKAGRVFVFPSHEEGWGIAIAEACACAVPVVSWDLPVYREIFENHTLQIEENNFNLFADQVVRLLTNDSSRVEIGKKGREFIQKYSWEEVAQKEWEIIKNR